MSLSNSNPKTKKTKTTLINEQISVLPGLPREAIGRMTEEEEENAFQKKRRREKGEGSAEDLGDRKRPDIRPGPSKKGGSRPVSAVRKGDKAKTGKGGAEEVRIDTETDDTRSMETDEGNWRNSSTSGGEIRSRSRGRPPTTGKFVGVGKKKAELQKKRLIERQVEELQILLQAEEREREERERRNLPPLQAPLPTKCSRLTCQLGGHPTDPSSDEEVRKKSPKETFKRLDAQAERILKVVGKSSNLKGTSVRELKDAVASIQEDARALRAASTSEEVKRLEKDNKKLRAQIDELVREVADIKKSVRTKGALPGETPAHERRQAPEKESSRNQDLEKLLARAISQFGAMVDAKLAVLEERLPPLERPMRPPLRADILADAAKKRGETREDKSRDRNKPEIPSKRAAVDPAGRQVGKGGEGQALPKGPLPLLPPGPRLGPPGKHGQR